jgi:hypothetical protein
METAAMLGAKANQLPEGIMRALEPFEEYVMIYNSTVYNSE